MIITVLIIITRYSKNDIEGRNLEKSACPSLSRSRSINISIPQCYTTIWLQILVHILNTHSKHKFLTHIPN